MLSRTPAKNSHATAENEDHRAKLWSVWSVEDILW